MADTSAVRLLTEALLACLLEHIDTHTTTNADAINGCLSLFITLAHRLVCMQPEDIQPALRAAFQSELHRVADLISTDVLSTPVVPEQARSQLIH